MKHFIIKNGCKVVCISAIALSSLSSCMKDDLTNCPAHKVSLKFDYTYNVENADAFSQEVKNLNVYVFDKNGKYFDTYTQSADKFETGHRLSGDEIRKLIADTKHLKEYQETPSLLTKLINSSSVGWTSPRKSSLMSGKNFRGAGLSSVPLLG